MSIQLNSTSGGSVSLDPVSSLASDITLTLPDSVGSAGQYLRNTGTAGTLEFGDLPAATPTAGQIIETVAGFCDGRQVTVGSGTYTLPTATSPQQLTTTFADVTGSNLSYTPPTGTNTVIYDFQTHVAYEVTAAPLAHFQFFVDSSEVEITRSTIWAYYDDMIRIRVILSLNNATEDIANAKIGTWNSARTLKIKAREYGTSNEARLHQLYHWNGSGGRMNMTPTLEITAIA